MEKIKKPPVALNTGNYEWYTPLGYIEAARKTMGSIDTDPASSEVANMTVLAKKYYTKTDNGLDKKWEGNVWLNPPYSKLFIADFSDALVRKIQSGETAQCVVLVNNATDTKWLQKMCSVASAICLHNRRIKFIRPDGSEGKSALQGQVILYFGPSTNVSSFKENFGRFGIIVVVLQNRTLEISCIDSISVESNINF